MIVLDASAALALLLRRPLASLVEDWLADADQVAHGPHLLPVEVAQVVRRFHAAGVLSAERGEQALADLVDLGVVLHDHEALLPTVWRLRDQLPVSDALYLALAGALDAPLLTFDAALAGATGHGARVVLLG